MTVTAPSVSITYGVCLRGRAGAVVTAERTEETRLVTGIERFGFSLEPMRRRLVQLREEHPDAIIALDAEGLGDALHELIGAPRPSRRFVLYGKRGLERQELTRTLLVGVTRRSFRFAADIEHAQAMQSALVSLSRRDPPEDGPGSELLVALSLALDPRRAPMPRIG